MFFMLGTNPFYDGYSHISQVDAYFCVTGTPVGLVFENRRCPVQSLHLLCVFFTRQPSPLSVGTRHTYTAIRHKNGKRCKDSDYNRLGI